MRVVLIMKYVFAVIGLGMLISAFYLYKNTNDFLNNSQTTSGIVVELVSSKSKDNSTLYKPVIEFRTKDGELIEFTASAASNPPSYLKGEAVQVFYKADAPYQAKVKGFFSLWGGTIIFAGIGLSFFIVGISMLITRELNKQKINTLKMQGTQIKAKIQEVSINRSYEVNGRSPYQIHAQWLNPSTSKVHIFKSDNLWFDPSDYIESDKISVLIDKRNPKKYYVDTSFLPELSK